MKIEIFNSEELKLFFKDNSFKTPHNLTDLSEVHNMIYILVSFF